MRRIQIQLVIDAIYCKCADDKPWPVVTGRKVADCDDKEATSLVASDVGSTRISTPPVRYGSCERLSGFEKRDPFRHWSTVFKNLGPIQENIIIHEAIAEPSSIVPDGIIMKSCEKDFDEECYSLWNVQDVCKDEQALQQFLKDGIIHLNQ